MCACGPRNPRRLGRPMTLRESFLARRSYFIVATSVVLADQLTKVAADVWLRPVGRVAIVPGFLNLWYSRNRGGLFGRIHDRTEPLLVLLLTGLPLDVLPLIAVLLVT